MYINQYKHSVNNTNVNADTVSFISATLTNKKRTGSFQSQLKILCEPHEYHHWLSCAAVSLL